MESIVTKAEPAWGVAKVNCFNPENGKNKNLLWLHCQFCSPSTGTPGPLLSSHSWQWWGGRSECPGGTASGSLGSYIIFISSTEKFSTLLLSSCWPFPTICQNIRIRMVLGITLPKITDYVLFTFQHSSISFPYLPTISSNIPTILYARMMKYSVTIGYPPATVCSSHYVAG